MKKAHGFTIVEILIVIVVIAILATISIVSYSGIQQRASNTMVISTASQTVKAIEAYIVATGSYPYSTTGTICLVPVSSGGCTSGGTAYALHTTTVNAIAAQMATLPSSVPDIRAADLGLMYLYNSGRTYDGVSRPAMLQFWLKGDMDCTLQGSASNLSVTTMPANYVSRSGGFTRCAISINGPAVF